MNKRGLLVRIKAEEKTFKEEKGHDPDISHLSEGLQEDIKKLPSEIVGRGLKNVKGYLSAF